ncbi:hypothetical protein C8R45DRAFT_135397 [Mycena sanguinolenta]|nr:hypothetical protein C8R45DRAFT_135397 [Mycena sanguinolenta]
MSLDTLPAELLLYLPQYLHSIEDLLSLFSTCRTLYRACSNPNPKIVLRLAAASGRVFFRPHPHLLLAATARQLADWAVEEDHRRYLLEAAFHGGVDKLFELAIDVVGLSMDDIHRLCTYKCDVLNPLNRRLDVAAGPATASNDYITVCNDPETTLLSWAIYGELFHHSLELAYLPFSRRCKPLSTIIRLKWFVYCMPDISFESMEFSPEEIPRFFAEEDESASREYVDRYQQVSMGKATRELLNDSLWKQELAKSPSFQATRRFTRETYISCAMHAGLKSLELLVPGGVEKLEAGLEVIAAGLHSPLYTDEEEAELQAGKRPAGSKDERLLKLIGDPWLHDGYPTLAADLDFTQGASCTQGASWPSDDNIDPLMKAIRSPPQKLAGPA